jgi:hypothetical protein
MKNVNIIEAKYINAYLLELVFDDEKRTRVDFGNFLEKHNHPQYNKYKKVENFKKFKIESGNVVWGKNWDLIFPIADLYNGKI